MCKALLRICGKAINVPVYAPKAGALPTALHPDIFYLLSLYHGGGESQRGSGYRENKRFFRRRGCLVPEQIYCAVELLAVCSFFLGHLGASFFHAFIIPCLLCRFQYRFHDAEIYDQGSLDTLGRQAAEGIRDFPPHGTSARRRGGQKHAQCFLAG